MWERSDITSTKYIKLLFITSGGEVGYLEYCYQKPKYLLAYMFTMWNLMNRSSSVAAQGITIHEK